MRWPPTRDPTPWQSWPPMYRDPWVWPPSTDQKPPLPASAVEYWHSELGISLVSGAVDRWRGQLRGTDLVPFTVLRRPAYQLDGTFFNGRRIVFMTMAGGRCLRANAIAPPLTLVGTRPHIYMIIRLRTALVALNFLYRSVNLAGTALSAGSFTDGAAPPPPAMQCFWFPHATVPVPAPALTPLRYETFINSAGNIVARIGGASSVGGVAGLFAPGDLERLGFGANPNDGQYTDSSWAFMLVCSSEITGEELADLDAWSLRYWGAT